MTVSPKKTHFQLNYSRPNWGFCCHKLLLLKSAKAVLLSQRSRVTDGSRADRSPTRGSLPSRPWVGHPLLPLLCGQAGAVCALSTY